jgi:hypothetical protein
VLTERGSTVAGASTGPNPADTTVDVGGREGRADRDPSLRQENGARHRRIALDASAPPSLCIVPIDDGNAGVSCRVGRGIAG